MPLKSLTSRNLIFGIGVLCSLATSDLAMAQAASSQDGCQASQPKGGADDAGNQKAAAADGGKLTDCDGVLKPPATGDGQMVSPAPDAGKTPVIPPSDMPNNSDSKQPQSK